MAPKYWMSRSARGLSDGIGEVGTFAWRQRPQVRVERMPDHGDTTPTISVGVPLTRTLVPTMSGAPPELALPQPFADDRHRSAALVGR